MLLVLLALLTGGFVVLGIWLAGRWGEAIDAGHMPTPTELIWTEAPITWAAGGWAMVAIALIALVMFGMAVHIFVQLWEKGFQFIFVGESTWRRWIDHPDERRGEIGDLLNFVTGGRSIKDTAEFFEELRNTEVAPFENKLRVMKVCVGAAPLLGLLGTVTGMLATFAALSSGSGGDETMGMVAAGISEALYTTATGLSIALPGLVLQQLLSLIYEWYKTVVAHLETVCTQEVYAGLQHRNQPDSRGI